MLKKLLLLLLLLLVGAAAAAATAAVKHLTTRQVSQHSLRQAMPQSVHSSYIHKPLIAT